MKRKIFCLSLIFLVCLFLFGCGGEKASSSLGGITGVAKLQGQSYHSGITVEILGTSKNTTTGSDGSYTFSNINATVVTLNFTKSGYASQTKAVNVSAGVTTNVATVTLSTSTGGISGKATLGGTAASGITVAISGTSTSTQTDSSGNFSFSDLSPGSYTLNYSYTGYISTSNQVTVSAGQTADAGTVNLTYGKGSITGKVQLDGQSNHSGITVTVTVNATALIATTVSDGSFTISDVPTGTHTLTASKSDYVSSSTSNISVEAAQATDIGTITLYEQATIQNQYDMSSILFGTILGMTCTNNYLYITTTVRLYKIDTTNPTAASPTSKEVTHNFTSLITTIRGGSTNIDCFAVLNPSSTPHGIIIFSYDQNLTQIGSSSQKPSYQYILQAVTNLDEDFAILYHDNAMYKFDKKAETETNYNVSEQNIVGLEGNASITNFYACNSTTIYKYNADFTIVTYKTLGTSDLEAIAFDGANIWVIDATTKKLYKITDDL